MRFQHRFSTASASPANLGGVGQPSEEWSSRRRLRRATSRPRSRSAGGASCARVWDGERRGLRAAVRAPGGPGHRAGRNRLAGDRQDRPGQPQHLPALAAICPSRTTGDLLRTPGSGRPKPRGRGARCSKHLHLANVRMSQSCRWSARTAEGTGWNAEQGLVRCAEAGQDSLGTNDRSTRLRSQR